MDHLLNRPQDVIDVTNDIDLLEISSTVHKWHRPFATGKLTAAEVTDHKKAFHLIGHSMFIVNLSSYGVNQNTINCSDFVRDRLQRLKPATR